MPLDREHITRASQIMLPAYVAAFCLLGLNYLVVPGSQVAASPPLSYVNTLIVIPVWGGLFLAAGLSMLAAMITAKRTPCRLALNVCWLSMAVWSGAFLLASLHGQATWGACILPALAATACFASEKSLAHGERD